MTDDLVARLRSYIPQGDGWNSEFANTLDEAANAIEAAHAKGQESMALSLRLAREEGLREALEEVRTWRTIHQIDAAIERLLTWLLTSDLK